VKEVEKHTDHVDILLANAGATWGAPFDEHPENAFAKVMDLNVKSVFVCIQKYVKLVQARGEWNADCRQIRTSPTQECHAGRSLASDHHGFYRGSWSWHAR
jgi:NAD(P)-dependent dehydrogenase (short-subunit alcohol dehydrogenase family)